MHFKQKNKTSRYKRQLRNTIIKLKTTEMKQKVGQAGLLKQLFNEDQETILKHRSEDKSCKCKKCSQRVKIKI
jgi:hypothetical protein